ncbi:hypothetical protein [Halanaerobacter jeridensis]|uniref:hypothetical protein n=1 Tax=Halanaerobacter jeridensis TaxID=706427 RepID=UPI00195E3AEF|nr:hypothetical protein [Halanaerobacter jeridensis]
MLENKEFLSRGIVIKDESSWDFMLDTENSLILIPYKFKPENLGYANQNGHFVLIPETLNVSYTIGDVVKLEKMDRHNRIDALKSMGLNKREAEKIYKDTHGYLAPIRRHQKLRANHIVPDWVNQFKTDILITTLIVTEWNSENENDKEIISKLADISYNDFETELLKLASVSDSPVRQVGNIWQVISKMDFWVLISHKINKKTIESLESIIFEVLGETDPSYDLSAE